MLGAFMNLPHPKDDSTTGFLHSKDKTPIFYRHYAVKDQKATVLVVHGFGEHSGRYQHVANALTSRHFEVYGIDFRGHGHSHGKKGDVESFEDYIDDLHTAIRFVLSKKDPKQKLFIVAHSMGALVSLRLLARNNEGISGLVLSAPLFALHKSIPQWKKCAAASIAKFFPALKFPSGIKGKKLSHDLHYAQAYDQDPLVLKCISVRAFKEIEEGMKGVSDLSLETAFFMQVAGDDSIVDSQATKKWFNKIHNNSLDATLKDYDGFLHEIYNEKNRKEAIDDALLWLEKRV